jgi:hypothetical protein
MKGEFDSTMQEILRQTKENEVIIDRTSFDSEVMKNFNIHQNKDGSFVVSREKRIELAMSLVRRGQDIAEVINLLTWKDFEGFIASILAEHGFRCIESFRRRGNAFIKGMEIDVLGVRGQSILSVDAKMWGFRSGKSSAIRSAAEKQKERTQRLFSQQETLMERLPIVAAKEYAVYPVIVTWLVEEVELHDGVPIVPVFKFSPFILDFDQYQDIIVSYKGQF